MFKSFFRNTSFVLLVNLIVKFLWVLGIEVWVQNRFNASEYGFYYTLLNLSLLFSFFLDFGISKYLNLQIAHHQDIKLPIIQKLLLLKFWFAVLYLACTFILSLYLELTAQQKSFLLILCLSQILLSFILYSRAIFTGLGKFKLEGVFSVLDRALMIIACIVWLSSSWINPRINQFIWIQFLGYLSAFLLASYISFKIVSANKPTKQSITRIDLKSVLVFVLPFAILNASEIINDRLGVVLLKELISDEPEQVGFYAYGQRWLDAFKMFASLIAIILISYYSRYLDSEKELFKLIKYCILFFVLPVTISAIVISANSQFFVELIYGNSSELTKLNFSYNILTVIPYSLIYVLQPLFMVNNKIRVLNMIFLSAIVINFSVSLLLIAYYQSVGCSIAFLITSSIVVFLQLLFSPKISLVKSRSFIVKISLTIAAVSLVVFNLGLLNPFLQLIISLLFTIALIFLLKLISIQALLDAFKAPKEKNKP